MSKLQLGSKGIVLPTGESVRVLYVTSNRFEMIKWFGKFDEILEYGTDDEIYIGVESIEPECLGMRSIVLLEDFQQDDV